MFWEQGEANSPSFRCWGQSRVGVTPTSGHRERASGEGTGSSRPLRPDPSSNMLLCKYGQRCPVAHWWRINKHISQLQSITATPVREPSQSEDEQGKCPLRSGLCGGWLGPCAEEVVLKSGEGASPGKPGGTSSPSLNSNSHLNCAGSQGGP